MSALVLKHDMILNERGSSGMNGQPDTAQCVLTQRGGGWGGGGTLRADDRNSNWIRSPSQNEGKT